MQSAKQCRRLAQEYLDQSKMPGVSPSMAAVLRNILRSFTGLASQYQLLAVIAEEERGQRFQ
jgi:hypothetical protein